MNNNRWIVERKDYIQLFIKVKTQARVNKIGGIYHDEGRQRLEVFVKAIRDKGKANEAVIELLSETLDVAKSHIFIAKGTTLSLKEIAIYNAAYDAVVHRLNQTMGNVL